MDTVPGATPHTTPFRRKAVACNSNIRIYRYAVGQRFGKHIDESVEDENGHLSQWTVLVYLNGGQGAGGSPGKAGSSEGGGGAVEEEAPLRGGETVFYKVRAESGAPGLALPSDALGAYHACAPATSG